MAHPLTYDPTPYLAGSTEPHTVEVICAMVRASGAALIVETGTFEAKTTRRLYETMRDTQRPLRLITVEMDEARWIAAEAQIKTWTDSLVAVEIWRTDALNALRQFNDNAVDFVFLDDDHSANHVAEELLEAKRILRPGGICCVHDVVGPFGLDAVVRAAGGTILHFERLHTAGGLGVVVKQ